MARQLTRLPPCPADFSLAAHVLGRSADLPDKIALRIAGLSATEDWTYGQLARAVRGVAGGLGRRALPDASRILLRIGNSADFPLAFLGAVAAGHLPVACPASLTGPEVTDLAASLAPALIIAGPGVSLPAASPTPVLTTDDLRDLARGPEAAIRTGDPDRPAYLVTTSGTSGRPRAVVHAHRAIWARRMMAGGWTGLTGADRLLHAGAMNWTFTLGTGLFDPWTAGATALIPGPGLAPADLPELLRRESATIFAAAPGIYRQMLRGQRSLDLPALRHGLSAGERLTDATRAAWTEATGTAIHEAFGMSECSTFLSGAPARPAPPGSIGYAQPGRRIAVLGPGGAPAPTGELAIHHSDPGLFLTYHGADDEARARFRDGWFLTGDLVTMAADGAVTYVGRADEMMNAGGFRLSPLEVEAALAGCPGAGDLAVTDYPLADDKSIIAAFYTGPATPADLARHADRCLAPYKRPRAYVPLPQLPMGRTGKINRRALREERIATHDQA